MSPHFTIFISSSKGFFKQIAVSKRQLFNLVFITIFVFFILFGFCLDYFFSSFSQISAQKYKAKNIELKAQLSELNLKMNKLNNKFKQIQDFSYKIKVIAGLEKSGSSSILAIGPLSPSVSFNTASNDSVSSHSRGLSFLQKEEGLSVDSHFDNTEKSISKNHKYLDDYSVNLDSLVVYMDKLDKKSELIYQDISIIMGQLFERQDIISSTPSISPVKGWVSSSFGYRESPFTGEVSLHEGLDIASFLGSPVYATASGVVVFAGYKKGYGKVVVIDHGYELSTLYAHLSDIMVSQWQKISRSEVIGSIGNTGHSTGPHLHYEVRISNVPIDPSNYILPSL